MDGDRGNSDPHLARELDAHLTAMTVLLAAVDAHADVPDDTRRCLRQVAAHVKALAEACRRHDTPVPPAGRGKGPVVGLTRREPTAAQKLAAGLRGEELAGAREASGLDRAALDPALVADLLERVRPSGTPRPEQLAKLTPQERRIFDLIGQGCTNRQIAARLFLAEKTVKNYVSNMLRKLGMERRTQAAVFATYLDRPDLAAAAPGTSRPA